MADISCKVTCCSLPAWNTRVTGPHMLCQSRAELTSPHLGIGYSPITKTRTQTNQLHSFTTSYRGSHANANMKFSTEFYKYTHAYSFKSSYVLRSRRVCSSHLLVCEWILEATLASSFSLACVANNGNKWFMKRELLYRLQITASIPQENICGGGEWTTKFRRYVWIHG